MAWKAQALCLSGGTFADAWNCGPEESDAKSVTWILNTLFELVPLDDGKVLNGIKVTRQPPFGFKIEGKSGSRPTRHQRQAAASCL